MKKFFLTIAVGAAFVAAPSQSTVYMTREISPEALVEVYKALGRPADGHRVAVKISTGDSAFRLSTEPDQRP